MLPKQLKYGSKTEAAWASSYRTNIAPQNGNGPYQLGNTIIINIPTSKNLVLATTESYLKFGVGFPNTAGTAAANVFRWDSCGAHGIIQRIRTFHGSNLICDTDNYGLLAKILFDLQISTDASYGRMNNLVGTRNDLITTSYTLPVAGGNPTLAATNYLSSIQVNSGEGFSFAATAAGTPLNSDGNNNHREKKLIVLHDLANKKKSPKKRVKKSCKTINFSNCFT
jgi:hypothetical protein